MKEFVLKHRIGLVVAFLVGLICILPQIMFVVSMGEEFRGVHLLRTPNEEGYIAIAQEILDGHPRVASMPFFEYKDKTPLLPSTLFRIYTVPVQLFGITLSSAVIAGKFVLPALLFFIVYLLLYDLIKSRDKKEEKLRSFFSVTAGIFVVFGFELVDYSSMISYLKGLSSPEGFLIWTRPINPVSGATLLFFFIYSLNKFNFQKKKKWIFWCGLSLALMMASYVFSWTLAVVVLGLYAFGALIKKRWLDLVGYISILILGILFSLKYWIINIQATKLDWYGEAAARIGMFHTHVPHFNKFTITMVIIFLLASFFAFYKKILIRPFPYWWWFSVILLASSLIVYNQQIITGVEIWYYHYVFYTIPFAYMVFMLLLWHILRERYNKIAKIVVTIILIASVSLGIFYQASAYSKRAPEYAERQYYRDVFDFFNQAEKDCVVLTKEEKLGWWSNLILAFTHCNSYFSYDNQSVLTNPDDFYHRYLSILRAGGLQPDNIEEFIEKNRGEIVPALQYQLQGTLGFSDYRLEERLSKMPEDYRKFVEEDFYTQLSKFRIDYILSEGELSEGVMNGLSNLEKVESINDMVIYRFK